MPVATWSDAIDTLWSSTYPLRKDEIHDNVFNSRPLLAWLKEKGKVNKGKSGLRIEEKLMYAENQTVKSFGRGDTFSLTPPETMTMSQWEWKFVGVNLTRYYVDEKKCASSKDAAGLVNNGIKNAKLSLSKELNRECFGDGTGNGSLDMDGLGNIIATDPTTGTVGGINRATWSFWRNNYKDCNARAFQTYGISDMRTMINDCEDDAILVDIIITSQTIHELYESEVGALQMVVPTPTGPRAKLSDLGFRALYFKEIPILFDKQIPDVTKMYFITSDSLTYYIMENGDYEMTTWKEIPNQLDKVAQIITVGNLTVNNSRRNGVLFNLAA